MDVISRLKNKGLYTEHQKEQPAQEKIGLQDRIEEILDLATNPSNFKRVFNAGQVLSIKELLQGQKRDKFCRQLVKTLLQGNAFGINHEVTISEANYHT